MSDPAPIMATKQTAQRAAQEKARPIAPEFSYALAAASLERSASQSLKAHGARPPAAETARQRPASGSDDSAGVAGKPAPAREADASVQTASKEKSQPATPPRADQPAAKPAAAPDAASSFIRAPVASSGAPRAPSAVESGALRETAAVKAKAVAARIARTPAAPAALKAQFAEILARRLDKTTVFDLRLDPPELGRVEGRLAINDDGKSVLFLTFDSKDAFDLYSGDAGALQRALEQAGLDFAPGDFTFDYLGSEAAGTDPGPIAEITADASSAYDPAFIASWSAGALDIRI